MEANDILKNGTYVGKSLLFPKKSIKVIIDNLMLNEQILIVTSCNRGSKPGALAVTNRRVIFGTKVLFTSEIKDFDIKKITSINYKSDLTNKLIIRGSFDGIEISSIEKNAGQQIVNKIKEIQDSEDPTNNQVTTNGLGDLEKLAELKDKGILTEEEFNAKKKSILGI